MYTHYDAFLSKVFKSVLDNYLNFSFKNSVIKQVSKYLIGGFVHGKALCFNIHVYILQTYTYITHVFLQMYYMFSTHAFSGEHLYFEGLVRGLNHEQIG